MILRVLIGVVAALFVAWALFLLALVLFRPKGMSLAETKRIVPDTVRLLRSLARDPALPKGVRRRIALVVYLASPLDVTEPRRLSAVDMQQRSRKGPSDSTQQSPHRDVDGRAEELVGLGDIERRHGLGRAGAPTLRVCRRPGLAIALSALVAPPVGAQSAAACMLLGSDAPRSRLRRGGDHRGEEAVTA